MPYVPHWRMTTHFNLGFSGTPKEEATCTLNFNPGAALAWTAAQDIANDAFADWATWVGDSGARVSSSVELDVLKMYSIDASGHMDEDPITAVGTPVSGTSSTSLHPWQCSVVMTLVSGLTGKGRFGRIYLPPQSYTVTQDGLIDPTQHGTMFTATKTLLEGLSNLPGLDVGWRLAIAGRTGTGTLRDVSQVRMGRVADTQRRRRRSLDEAYVTGAFSG